MKDKMKLADISNITSGFPLRGPIADFDGNDIYLLQSGDLPDDFIISDTLTLQEIKSVGAKDAMYIRNGDVVLSARGGVGSKFRASAVHGEFNKPIVASVSTFILRPCAGLMPEYLALYLNSPEGQAQLQSMSRGSTVAALSKNDLVSFTVPLVSVEKQLLMIDLALNIREQNDLLGRRMKLQSNILKTLISNVTK